MYSRMCVQPLFFITTTSGIGTIFIGIVKIKGLLPATAGVGEGSPIFAWCGRHLIKGSRPYKGLNWLKSGEIFVKISHLRLILKARCGKHGYYPSISQHIIDIHQLIAIETYSDPYLVSYNPQKSQIKPFSAKMAPEWPFLRKFDDENTQKLVKIGQDVEISLQHNNFRP